MTDQYAASPTPGAKEASPVPRRFGADFAIKDLTDEEYRALVYHLAAYRARKTIEHYLY